MEPRLEKKRPLLPGFGRELNGSGPVPSRQTTARGAGRVRPYPSRAGRDFPGQMVLMPYKWTALVPLPVADFHLGTIPGLCRAPSRGQRRLP